MQKQETKNNCMIIGSHVKMSAPEYFLGSVKEALSYGANAMMIYTGAPQNFNRVEISRCKIEEGRALLASSNIDINNVICHAPYLINLANTVKPGVYDTSLEMLINELNRTDAFGIKIFVLHPGASVGGDVQESIDQVIKGINTALENTSNVKIAIETMAGKGSEVGISFEQIAYIIENIKNKDRIGVCIDTCHMNDSGYDVLDFDNLINDIEKTFGIKNVLAIHLNDSNNIRGSHKDRHNNLGFGTIGFDALYKFATAEEFKSVPKILETPYFDEKAPYGAEINMLKKGIFDKDALTKL